MLRNRIRIFLPSSRQVVDAPGHRGRHSQQRPRDRYHRLHLHAAVRLLTVHTRLGIKGPQVHHRDVMRIIHRLQVSRSRILRVVINRKLIIIRLIVNAHGHRTTGQKLTRRARQYSQAPGVRLLHAHLRHAMFHCRVIRSRRTFQCFIMQGLHRRRYINLTRQRYLRATHFHTHVIGGVTRRTSPSLSLHDSPATAFTTLTKVTLGASLVDSHIYASMPLTTTAVFNDRSIRYTAESTVLPCPTTTGVSCV